jgi:hypothetical protein
MSGTGLKSVRVRTLVDTHGTFMNMLNFLVPDMQHTNSIPSLILPFVTTPIKLAKNIHEVIHL